VAGVDLNYDAGRRKRMALQVVCGLREVNPLTQLEILRLATQVVERSLADDSAERPAVTVVSMKPTSS
jgi:hypothetical protein